ncbi:MAG: hypothetical protein KGN79_14320 [Acidobacteriota bacterium]|nr:hypothetical protein [Acidobacteriota bacterium]
MSDNFYSNAYDQAANERSAIRAQMELLLARDAKLERLLEVLKDLLPTERMPHNEMYAGVSANEHSADRPA